MDGQHLQSRFYRGLSRNNCQVNYFQWYRIDTSSLTVNQSGYTFVTASSADFNPHLCANGSYAFMNWSSTDAANGVNAQVRFSGKLNGEVVIDGGAAMFTSPTFYGSS